MKKIAALIFVLLMSVGVTMNAFAASSNSGSPDFSVSTALQADRAAVLAGETVNLTATTTYTSQKKNQLLYLASESWTNVSSSTASAQPYETQTQFVSTAQFSSDIPGIYTVGYGITLKHDESGKRTYTTVSAITITVAALPRTALTNGEIESIFSAWKHNKTFANGNGQYSTKWYNDQLDLHTFYEASEVTAFLDGIYVAQ